MPDINSPRRSVRQLFLPSGLFVIAALLLAAFLFFRQGGWSLVPTSSRGISVPLAPSIAPSATTSIANSYQLVVGKISVTAPLILDVSGTDEPSYLTALEHGVAQYAGTAHPGQTGNMVIFGHSSYYRNNPGEYKEIFRHLNQLAVGDPIRITRQGQTVFTYQVTGSRIVSADDLSVLRPTASAELTLLTCWPPGTTDKRYVVTARLAASAEGTAS